MGKLDAPVALGDVFAQLASARVDALPLLGWGAMGHSVAFGAILPGEDYAVQSVLLGEALTMCALIAAWCVCFGLRGLCPFTPALVPFEST
jgi:aquaporin Z